MSYFMMKGVTKRFGKETVLDRLSFTIEKGEFITLLGPSGCGKSTLLRCIAGLTRPDEGTIAVDGREIGALSPRERNIAMVFQSYALFPNMNVRENIAFGLRMRKLPKVEIVPKVEKALALVELSGKEKAYPHELSGGQQQRVALARAIVMEPKILLLDEPLSALDAKIRKSLRLQIRGIQKELDITTIFVTHDQEEALILSDRLFLMDKGKLSQIGTPEELYINPKNEFAARFMGNYNVFGKAQLEALTRRDFEGALYAIRPEALSVFRTRPAGEILSKDSLLQLSGTIEDTIVLGSVLRNYVKVNGLLLIADVLNRGEDSYFEIGSEVFLTLPVSECKRLEIT